MIVMCQYRPSQMITMYLLVDDVDSGEGYMCREKIIEKIYLPLNFPVNLSKLLLKIKSILFFFSKKKFRRSMKFGPTKKSAITIMHQFQNHNCHNKSWNQIVLGYWCSLSSYYCKAYCGRDWLTVHFSFMPLPFLLCHHWIKFLPSRAVWVPRQQNVEGSEALASRHCL